MHDSEIELGAARVIGTVPGTPGLLNVRIPLSQRPDQAWVQLFEHPPDVGRPSSMHRPRLEDDTIAITPPDAELERYMEHVRECVAAANAEYERSVRPKLIREDDERDAAKHEHARRIEDAQRRLDESS